MFIDNPSIQPATMPMNVLTVGCCGSSRRNACSDLLLPQMQGKESLSMTTGYISQELHVVNLRNTAVKGYIKGGQVAM